MSVDLFQYEPAIRLGFFVGVLSAMAAWEMLAPRRGSATSKPIEIPSAKEPVNAP